MFQKIIDKLKELFGGKPLEDVDLAAELDKQAEGQGLKWKTSIVDLLTLLEIDSSKKNREELAAELGVEGIPGSPAKNEALRLAVFKKLKENGGQVPDSLTD